VACVLGGKGFSAKPCSRYGDTDLHAGPRACGKDDAAATCEKVDSSVRSAT